jgi:hypothetical protein
MARCPVKVINNIRQTLHYKNSFEGKFRYTDWTNKRFHRHRVYSMAHFKGNLGALQLQYVE